MYLKTALDYINTLKEFEHIPVPETGPIYVYGDKENDEFINELLKTKEKYKDIKIK